MKILTTFVLGLMLNATQADDDDFQVKGRHFSEQFLAGETAEIWAGMTPEMQEALKNATEFNSFSRTVVAQAGQPGRVIREELVEQQGYHVFRQLRRFGNLPQPVVLQWAFDGDGRIAGFFVRPQPDPPSDAFEEYRTRTELRLPFEGAWFVFWGGRERTTNYHVDYPNQRYAYDLLVMKDGASYAGDPKVLENYHCWSEPILAPADGRVVVVENSQPDQAPGEMDPSNPAGNYVIIDHGHGEYSLLAHMQQGSISTKAGKFVIAGQAIGRCGNSGNTTEPHLHFHLQNGRSFGEGHGLPAPFVHYVSGGAAVARGEPVRGQTISPRAESE